MAAKKTAKPAKKAATKKHGPRADLGAPVESFFAKQPEKLRPVLVELRKLVDEIAPRAESSIKWGMPFYAIDGKMMCAIGAHKSHVNLILSGPPEAFDDPDDLLTGAAKTGRHLKVTSVDEIPRAAVRKWLRTAMQLAKKG